MCLIFLSIKQHPTYKLIVAANRDEFYNRRTQAADFWIDQPNILAGRDLEAGGTWLGVSRTGKISMVTNFRDPKNIRAKAPSRGHLVSDFLANGDTASQFINGIVPKAKLYNGFNLIGGTADQLFYFSNYSEGITSLEGGLYGLSNHLLDTPWPKVVRGKKRMAEVLQRHFKPSDLFEVLVDEDRATDDLLPDTGVGLERERALSSMFIKMSGYGTRCSTVVLVDHSNNLFFAERVYDLNTFQFSEKSFTFKIAQG